MKKMKRFFALCAVSFAAVSVFAAGAKVVSVTGKAEIQEGSIWAPLSAGDTIDKGTVISTGFKSSVVVSFNQSKFTLGPLTRITIDELISSETKDNTELYISCGSISASVNKEGGKAVGFKVRSPVATASVRGTEFKMTSRGKLSVSSGLVGFGPKESRPSGKASPVAEERKDSQEQAPKSTVFTSASDVGNDGATPVFAGQTSKTDLVTGKQSSPAAEKAMSSRVSSDGVSTLAQKEAVTTTAGSSASIDTKRQSSVSIDTKSQSSAPNGGFSLTIKFAD